MDHDEEVQIARRGNRAEKQVDKFFQRAPFVYTVMAALLAGCVTGGWWTATLQSRIGALEEFRNLLEHDDGRGPIIEQTHATRTDIERNKKQIRALNSKVFNFQDTGE